MQEEAVDASLLNRSNSSFSTALTTSHNQSNLSYSINLLNNADKHLQIIHKS